MEDADYSGQVQMVNQNMDNASSLFQRLDLTDFYEDVKRFLSGCEVVIDPETGQTIKIPSGVPMCNDLGVQGLLQMVKMRVNRQTVQGYTDDDRYNIIVFHFRLFFSKDLMLNRRAWGITSENYGVICNGVCDCVELYLTRTLYNSERNSYAKTMQMVEQHKIGGSQTPQKFGIFGN